MDHYPEVNVSERECPREDWSSSRHDSASSLNKAAIQHSLDSKSKSRDSLAPPQYTSYPSSTNQDEQRKSRNDSVHELKNGETNSQLHPIEAEYARYTEAPPPYSEKQYEGKSEEERTRMRMRDYAKELSRMMGRQLVRGIKTGQGDKSESK